MVYHLRKTQGQADVRHACVLGLSGRKLTTTVFIFVSSRVLKRNQKGHVLSGIRNLDSMICFVHFSHAAVAGSVENTLLYEVLPYDAASKSR